MPDFEHRSKERELMDNLSVGGDDLWDTLLAIRRVNRWLGGYAVSRRLLLPLIQMGPVRLLDVGAGLADHAVYLVDWAHKRGFDLRITAIDANIHAVSCARRFVTEQLPPELAERIEIVYGDAVSLPFEDNSFDASMASLFLHHFDDRQAPRILKEMARVASRAVLIGDLHRSRVAWLSFRLVSRLIPGTAMFRKDGALSVLRGFSRSEMTWIAREAGLERIKVHWHWAFRWGMRAVAP